MESGTGKSYDFTKRKRAFGRVVFALTLNRKRMVERVVIGRVNEVRRVLGGGDGEIFYDEVRPLGSLLLTFGSDKDGEWNSRILPLRESYGELFPPSARWKAAAPVVKFLESKYKSGEPSAMFAAIRTWEEYLDCFSKRHGTELLSDRLFMLYKPFRVYSEHKPWHESAAAALSVAMRDEESKVELWYLEEPDRKRKATLTPRPRFEVIVSPSSFLPVIFYYMNKVGEWGLVFQQCKVCEKYFAARSRHYELCSDECRKRKAVEAKQEFDERTKDDKLEQIHNTAYYFWYNRLRKLEKGKAANPEGAAAFNAAFEAYRKEAKKRKAAVKRREISLADFSSWVAQMQNEAERLMGEFAPK